MKRIGYIDARRLSLLDGRAIGLGTDRGVTITPSDRGLTIASTWTEAGETGRPLMAQLTTDVTLGGWANAFKAYVDLQTEGGATGLLSASCHEVLMATEGVPGAVAAVEMEIVYGATCGGLPQPSFMFMNTDGVARGDFDTYGDLFKVSGGPTPDEGNFISLDTNTMRVGTGVNGSVHRYLPLSLTENILDYDVSELAVNGRIAKFTGTVESPFTPDTQGFFEVGLTISGVAGEAAFAAVTKLAPGAACELQAGGNYGAEHLVVDQITGAATIAGAFCIGRYSMLLDDAPTHLSIWQLNFIQTIDGIFETNDPVRALGYAPTQATGPSGSIPFYFGVGGGAGYIMIYTDPA